MAVETLPPFLMMGVHSDAVGRAVNFGSGNDVTIVTIAQMIRAAAGSRSEIVHIENAFIVKVISNSTRGSVDPR